VSLKWMEDHRHHHNWWLVGHETAKANILLCFGGPSIYHVSATVDGASKFSEKYTLQDAKLDALRLIRVLEGKTWAMNAEELEEKS